MVDSLGEALTEILAHSSEDRHCERNVRDHFNTMLRTARTLPGLDNGALDTTKVNSNVVNEVLLILLAEDFLPESTGLLEVD